MRAARIAAHAWQSRSCRWPPAAGGGSSGGNSSTAGSGGGGQVVEIPIADSGFMFTITTATASAGTVTLRL